MINKKYRLPILIVLILFFSIYYYFDFGCLFLKLFHIPCPGCGMTRAIKAALRFDFKAMFYYNPAVIFLPYIFSYFFIGGIFLKYKIINNLIIALMLIVLFVQYVFKLLLFFNII